MAAWALDGARRLAPSSRGEGSRVVAPHPRVAEDVLAVRPVFDRPVDFVTQVIDGDTVRLRHRGLVRLIGVDTPETVHPRKPVQRCGPEASAFTRAAIEKRWVALEQDREARDKYGRWLAYLHREPDRFFLNAEIVRQGAGRAYTVFPFRHRDWFRELERASKQDGLGLWGPRRRCELPEPVAALALPGQPAVEPPAEQAPAPAASNLPAAESASPAAEPPPESPAPNLPPAQPFVREGAPRAAHREPPLELPPGAAAPMPGRRPGCDIKGNIGGGGERIYHLPGGSNYARTRIDETKGERWFCSEEEADQAGWRKARN